MDFLRDGDFRLQGNTGAFLYRRLRPGVLLTSFQGNDTGEFANAPLDILAEEHRYFAKPVEWFFDATLADRITGTVSEQWIAWLRQHRAVLSRMHVLTAGQGTHLRISVARHFSDSIKEIALYTDRARWESALRLCAPDPPSFAPLNERFAEPALPIDIVSSREDGLTLTAPNCRWHFRSLGQNVVFTTFAGDDEGDLTRLALGEMQKRVDSARGKISWFLDLREARNVATHVSEVWTAWLSAHQDRLARVTALSAAPLFPLVLTVAKYRSGSERLFRIHREIEPFREELVALTSGDVARAVGV